MQIFEITKHFPREEVYSLTDQIRRSSCSVCANLAEAWRKRRYEGAFVSKLSDAEAEAAETQTWLEFSVRCEYLDANPYHQLYQAYDNITLLRLYPLSPQPPASQPSRSASRMAAMCAGVVPQQPPI